MSARDHRAYRALLSAWPRGHRERYGPEMEDAFMSLLRMDRERSGMAGTVRCWAGALVDAMARGLVMRLGMMIGVGTDAGSGTNTGRGGRDIMGTITADIRYAVRSLTRRPVFAFTAILTIAIGIGANASVFTVVKGFMLTPLPYENPDELVAVWAAQPTLGWSHTNVSHADAWDWRERAATLEDLAVTNGDGFNLTGGDRPELVSGLRVTPNFLSVVGRQPALGRDFTADEMGPGQDHVVILMDGFWERRFARDRDVLGSVLTLDGEQVTVVGIMPADFLYHNDRPDVLRPWHFDMATVPRATASKPLRECHRTPGGWRRHRCRTRGPRRGRGAARSGV